MSGYLHGGGIPLVAETPASEIWQALGPASGKRFKQEFFPYSAGKRLGEPGEGVTVIATPSPSGRATLTTEYSDKVRQQLKWPRFDASGNTVGETHPAAEQGIPRLYDRIVKDPLKGPQPSEEALRALALAMKKDTTPQTTSGIPAAYTYLGQFIAHDMTWMKPSGDPKEPFNARTHALDLDSLFGALPEGHEPVGNFQCGGGLCVGETTMPGRFEDLPRDATGYPCIADPRNDNNLAVAQLTVAITKFHQVVCRLTTGCSPADQRTITMRHFQSVVLHDYLPRIIHEDVYCDVLHHGGRKVIFPTLPPLFQVSTEFAAACFRFGHSMVRETYNWNEANDNAAGSTLRRFSHAGVIKGTQPILNDDWVADWNRLLTSSCPGDQRHLSAGIDSQINSDLTRLDEGWIDPGEGLVSDSSPINLAELTLLKGARLGLPTGQILQQYCENILGAVSSGTPALTDQQLRQGVVLGLPQAAANALTEQTPLWFYVLQEAKALGGGGHYLGPLGSRIVIETILAAIEATPDNIITGPQFTPLSSLACAETDRCTLGELIAASRQFYTTNFNT